MKTAVNHGERPVVALNHRQGILKKPVYQVPNHVRYCRAGGETIFLDLKANAYFAIHRAQSVLLEDFVVDWPERCESTVLPARTSLHSPEKVLQTLLERGLLTLSTSEGSRATQTDVDVPYRDLLNEYRLEHPPIRPGHVIRFGLSCVSAWTLLRTSSLNRIVELMDRRKRRTTVISDGGDGETATQLVTIYLSLRPFFFEGKDACLFDSLVLFEFLRRHGVYSTWVIGVMSAPFQAHSWLQRNGTVLNDQHTRVSSYTPIVAV